MLEQHVAVVQVNLGDRCLGDEVEDVGAGAAEADDRDLVATQSRGGDADAGAARCGLDVLEDGLLVGCDHAMRDCGSR